MGMKRTPHQPREADVGSRLLCDNQQHPQWAQPQKAAFAAPTPETEHESKCMRLRKYRVRCRFSRMVSYSRRVDFQRVPSEWPEPRLSFNCMRRWRCTCLIMDRAAEIRDVR